jgi:cysteate synthase
VKVIAVNGGDYSDAIRLSESVAKIPGFFAEGGVKNVARRAGLGTVLMSVFEKLWQMPDYYFQAIGSGTGAIAVHETARQLTEGQGPFPRLWLSQNEPFVPVYDAWTARKRHLARVSEGVAKEQIGRIGAKVLANRFPPYAVRGGIYDALVESGGTVLAVSNAEAEFAAGLFETGEGIDIAPAAAVAFASLLQATEDKRIPSTATVVLNVTGGGQRRRLRESKTTQPMANLSIAAAEIGSTQCLQKITALFERNNRGSIPCLSIDCNSVVHYN